MDDHCRKWMRWTQMSKVTRLSTRGIGKVKSQADVLMGEIMCKGRGSDEMVSPCHWYICSEIKLSHKWLQHFIHRKAGL